MTTGKVIVAGSGASGLVAALAAAAGGADVLVLERSELLGGTTALGGGRVWVPANHCPENAGDSAEAARAYLGGLFPARYAHLTDAFLANAPAMARFVEERSPHRFAACPAYPDYHPERTGATAGGRCLDMELADLSAMAPQARQVRVPPGYLRMTQAEWEGWRFPGRFVDEASPYNEVGKAMHRADDGGCQNDLAFLTPPRAWNNRTILAVFRKLWISALPAVGNSIPSAPRSTTTACRPSARRRTPRA